MKPVVDCCQARRQRNRKGASGRRSAVDFVHIRDGNSFVRSNRLIAVEVKRLVGIRERRLEDRLDQPQMIVALVSAWQSGTVPKRDVQVYLQRVGLIDPEKSPEEIDAETAGEGINLG
jgi:hypothetical protein